MAQLTSFVQVVRMMWTHGPALVKVADTVVPRLGELGGALEEAAGLLATLRTALDDPDPARADARKQIDTLRRTTESCNAAVEEVKEGAGSLAERIRSVRVPRLVKEARSVGVKGSPFHATFDIWVPQEGEALDGAADAVEAQRDSLTSVQTGLDGAGRSLRELDGVLGRAAGDLDRLSTLLRETGRSLRQATA